MKQNQKSQRGAMTIVEATFVFPITFIIVLLMVMAGEAYYQRARVESVVTQAAISGAARCENPMLGYVSKNKKGPGSPSETDVLPYRYILTGEAKQIAADVERELEDTLETMTPLLFKGMKPANVDVTIDPKMNILVSSFPVECEFEIPLPIRMIFSDQPLAFRYRIKTTASVGDPSEFVRNVALVKDIVERSKEATEFFGKIKKGLDDIGVYIN